MLEAIDEVVVASGIPAKGVARMQPLIAPGLGRLLRIAPVAQIELPRVVAWRRRTLQRAESSFASNLPSQELRTRRRRRRRLPNHSSSPPAMAPSKAPRRARDLRQLLDPQDGAGAAWLAPHKRFKLHFVPTSSSWLNLVERLFARKSVVACSRASSEDRHQSLDRRPQRHAKALQVDCKSLYDPGQERPCPPRTDRRCFGGYL